MQFGSYNYIYVIFINYLRGENIVQKHFNIAFLNVF